MSATTAVARLTLRQLLARRRALGLAAFGALPVLLALLFRAQSVKDPDAALIQLYMDLVIPVTLPIVALVVGTGVFGAEIEDGTALYVLAKPVARWRIVLIRLLIAAGVAVLMTVPALLAAAGMVGGAGSLRRVGIPFAAPVAAGALLYCALFVALSLATRRALLAGLGYVAIWEGIVATRFAATRFLSVREYTLGTAAALYRGPAEVFKSPLAGQTVAILAVLVTVAATLYAIRRLRSFEVGEAA